MVSAVSKKDQLANRRLDITPRGFEDVFFDLVAYSDSLAKTRQSPLEPKRHGIPSSQEFDQASGDGKIRVFDQGLFVKKSRYTESLAIGASSLRGVETQELRCWIWIRTTTLRTGIELRVDHIVGRIASPFGICPSSGFTQRDRSGQDHGSFSEFNRFIDRLDHHIELGRLEQIRTDLNAIDHHIDIVFVQSVEIRG